MGENLDEIGPKLEKTLEYEKVLHGEEAEALRKYVIVKGLRILEKKTEPVPEMFKDIVKLYGLDVPIYIIPVSLMGLFTDAIGPGTVWWDASSIPPKPIAILLASDAVRRGYKNKNKSMLRSLLFCIGRILFNDEISWFIHRMIEKMKKLTKDAEGTKVLMSAVRLAVTNRLEKWEKEQYRLLKKFMNSKATNWKRGLSFEQVRGQFRYDHSKYRMLFEFDGEAPQKLPEKKLPYKIMLVDIDQIKLPDWLEDEK